MSDTHPSPADRRRLFVISIAGGVTVVFICSLCCLAFWWLLGFGASSQFDPNDIVATERWAAGVQRKMMAVRQNEIAFADANAEFDKAVAKHVGKKIRWRMSVMSVSKEFVSLRPWLGGIPGHSLHTIGVFADPLKVGDGISRDKAAALRQDQTIVVLGTIKGVSFTTTGAFCPMVQLENTKAE